MSTAGRVRYPDATVVCGPIDPAGDSVEPAVINEVLSPSTALTVPEIGIELALGALYG